MIFYFWLALDFLCKINWNRSMEKTLSAAEIIWQVQVQRSRDIYGREVDRIANLVHSYNEALLGYADIQRVREHYLKTSDRLLHSSDKQALIEWRSYHSAYYHCELFIGPPWRRRCGLLFE